MNLVSPVADAFGNDGSAPIVYQGLAPTFAGIDQINMVIPAGAQEGCAVPLSFQGAYQSPKVTVSIHTGRSRCIDPPRTYYGQVTLVSTPGISDTIAAVFPSGPDVRPPALVVHDTVGQGTAPSVSRSCTVAGYSDLSAGVIAIQGPGSVTATVPPQAQATGFSYQSTLPAGFIGPGQYTVSSAQNAPAAFAGTFTVGAPIQLQSTFPTGTNLAASAGFRIQWTGGDPNDLVRVRLISPGGITALTNTYWTTVGAGSITITGSCTPGPTPIEGNCLWPGLPPSNNAKLIIDVLPSGGVAATSGTTQFVWDYRYVFDSLSLGS